MDTKDLWLAIIEKLLEKLNRAQIITWFKNTAIISYQDGIVNIGLPLPFFLNWHMTHFSQLTLEAAQKIDPQIKQITYSIEMSLGENDPRAVDLLKHFPETTARKLPKKNEQKTKEGIITRIFNPKYTLENFITSPENLLAHAACTNVAKYPGKNYNPLFIYGGVGLGKTHLLQATGNEIMRNDPTCFVVYTTTEEFINEVVNSITSKNMNHFRNKYRRVDALIIDDIQFIANKDRTQEEFFHTFNALYESGKQIIISSDRPPSDLTLLSERLVSRFESGMIVDVQMPDYETRLAILQNNCQEAQVFINHEVLEFIAYNVTSSVRALEGVLKQAVAKYELEHTSPTVKSVAEMLKQTQKEIKMIGYTANDIPEHQTAVTIDSLIDSVSGYYTVTKSDVIGNSRARDCIVPRQVIMYLAKTKLRMSLAKIGKMLGDRNHTTVMHSVNRVEQQLKSDRQLLRDINAIAKESGIC
jgi:chromosomal replication initiator protein